MAYLMSYGKSLTLNVILFINPNNRYAIFTTQKTGNGTVHIIGDNFYAQQFSNCHYIHRIGINTKPLKQFLSSLLS